MLNASGYIYNKVPSAPGNHAKIMIIDNEAYVVGSDNLYPGSLAEFDYLVEGADAVAELLKVYWEPLWKYAGPHARTANYDPPAPAFRLGPAGATGTAFDDTSSTQRISSIDVYAGEIVDGIRATHADGTVTRCAAATACLPAVRRRRRSPSARRTRWSGSPASGARGTAAATSRRSCSTSAAGRSSQVFGTGASTSGTQPFDLQAPSPQSQEVTGFFGAVAAADNNTATCLAAIGIVAQ